MGFVIGTILLRNARLPRLALQIDARVDSSVLHLYIPQSVCTRLHLEKVDDRQVTLADGLSRVLPYVGPVEIRVGHKAGFAGGVVTGNQVVLGTMIAEILELAK